MNEENIEIERERYPFIVVEKAIFDDHRTVLLDGKPVTVGKYEILTYAAVCYFADGKNGTAYPSYDTISDIVRLGRTTVYRALKHLVALGYLEVKNRRKRDSTGEYYQTSNLYTILSQYKVIHEKAVDNLGISGGLSSPHELTPVRHTNSNKNYITRISNRRDCGLVDNFFQELFSTYKIYSDFKLSISDSEKIKLEELISKYGSEKVLDVWGDYQKQKPGKPVKIFIENFGVYNKTPETKKNPKSVTLKEIPKKCPECGSRELQKVIDAFRCLHCSAWWDFVEGEWVQAVKDIP